jgi:hypothetical protein
MRIMSPLLTVAMVNWVAAPACPIAKSEAAPNRALSTTFMISSQKSREHLLRH